MRTEHFTRAQIEHIPRWREAWIDIISDTALVDRPRAEAAIARIYQEAGEAPPAFIWVGSPAAATFAIAWLRSLAREEVLERRLGVGAGQPLARPLLRAPHPGKGASAPASLEDWLDRQVSTHPVWQLGVQIGQPIASGQVTDALWDELCQIKWALRTVRSEGRWSPSLDLVAEIVIPLRVVEPVQLLLERARQVAAELDTITPAPTDDEDWSWPHEWLSGILHGRNEGEIAKYAFARAILGADLPGLAPWEEAARACGLWWPLRRICIACERPLAVHRDNRGRVHHPSQAAVRFDDGFAIHAWHGTQVPADWITKSDRLDPRSALDRAINVERRRAAAEIVGWSRVLEHLTAQVIDRNPDPMIGELLEALLPPEQEYVRSWDGDLGSYAQKLPPYPARFLRVRCATGRDFVLSVPRELRTALEANAWTYGMRPEEYQLEVRT